MLKTFADASPAVAPTAFVSEMAYLVGDVTVGEEASIWPFVCLRGDYGPVEVGRETNVQELSMIHDATLGERVTVGHGVVVDRATVEGPSLVGIGSSVLSGATVESNAIVAAGAVVPEGDVVPEGHVAYGVPAETRPLTDGQRDRIGAIADSYRDLSRRYREEGGFEADRRSAGDGT